MKHIRTFTAVLLAMSLPTGCELIYPESSDSENTSSSESSPESTSSSTENSNSENSTNISSSTETTIRPEPPEVKPVIYPEMKIKLSSEMEEIMELFGDLGAFYHEYLGLEPAWERITSRKGADGFRNENDRYFGKIVNADITTYSALMAKLKSMLTDKCIEDTSENILDWFSTNENDELYVQNRGAGGYLGTDYIRINSIDYPNNETIELDMSTVGEKENWGLEEDWIDDFKITLKKTDCGLRINEIGNYPYFDFAYLKCVVYNNVNMVLDNAPEYVKKAREESDWQRPLTETEEIIKLLEDYSDFFFAMAPSYPDNEKFMDKSQKITIDAVNSLNEPYTAEYYKAVGLPANTLDELNEKLDGFVTEKPKSDFLKMTDDNFFTVADNGDIYISNYPFGRATVFDKDKLYLDSIEYPDDNTILVTVTSFRDKESWGTVKDIIDTSTAKIIRTDDGLRINECNIDIISYFGSFDEIIFDDIPLKNLKAPKNGSL